MGLIADLGRGALGLDTVIFLYFIENNSLVPSAPWAAFKEVDNGRRELVTSALTLLALLVVPYRSGDHLLAERYEALLTRSRGVHVAEISRDHLRASCAVENHNGSEDARLSSACGSFGDWLCHLSYEWSRPPDYTGPAYLAVGFLR